MIELRGLSAGYAGKPVLQDISLAFPPGRVTVLLGPNGCGKSTLLRTALGLHRASAGQVLLDGMPLESLTPRQIAQKAAYLAQSHMIPNITAERMVLHGRFPYLAFPRRYRPQDYTAAREALRWVDAENLRGCLMGTLSGGQRQKVYLAMILAQDTDSVFMDEPTTYLDIRCQMDVMDLARRLAQQGKAVVLVLHDLCLAMRTADQAVVLEGGRLCQRGTPEEVFESGVLEQVFRVSVCRVRTEDGWQYYCV